MTLRNAFEGLATEQGQQDNKQVAELLLMQVSYNATLQASIAELNESMTYLLSAMLEKMPRLDSGDRAIVRVVNTGENDLSSPWGGAMVNGVGNPNTGAQFMRTFEPWNFSDTGAARIYQQIQVTA